eukprot:gnl/TRDRNA2_/TRDRNA2_50244_c0_seq1.p1 gnl/TRDRNA2_/TRDRNA2_50244_c0~~gnl/TRDRNA2_/TRDRNA2_50244_c0_seq1.p1  ORF type:complete len:371 (+),score=65.39 gnl/TRDRNA2_/TRDRNA2_50244_c0_seq1:169-1281(+)
MAAGSELANAGELPAHIDPRGFRAPRKKGIVTRHLYLANCGAGKGDTAESVLVTLLQLAPGAKVEGLHIGDAGVSYVSFTDATMAEQALAGVLSTTKWVARFAECDEETGRGRVLMPSSVASTADVDIPGLVLVPNFVSDQEAKALLEAVDGGAWDNTIKRRVQHYGHAFDYARLAIADRCRNESLPDFCSGVVQKLAEGNLLPHPVDQLTINEYQPGVGIAFHVDAHSAFEDGIAAVTLGSGIVMEFRRIEDVGKVAVGTYHRGAPPPEKEPREPGWQKNVWLPPNSLLVMKGEARYAWQHGIAWRKTDCLNEGEVLHRGRRVSLTLRTARRAGPCNCAWPAACDGQNPEAHGLPSRVRGEGEEPTRSE